MTLWHCDTVTVWDCETVTLWHCVDIILTRSRAEYSYICLHLSKFSQTIISLSFPKISRNGQDWDYHYRLVVKARVHSLFSSLSGSLPHNCSISTSSRMEDLSFIKGRLGPVSSSASSWSMLVERFLPIWNSYSSNQAKMFNLFQDTKNSRWKVFLNQFGV